jgi:alkylation response protein AidB-like acyl-CoA dehydrogenase
VGVIVTMALTAPQAWSRLTIVKSAELDLMAETVRTVVATEAPASRVAAVADGPDDYDTKLWQVLSSDLGITGLLVPSRLGGLGLGWREVRVIMAELGRGLACVPFLSSCVIAPAVLLSDDSTVATELLPQIAAGSTIVAVALGDETLLGPEPTSGVSARPDEGGGWRLSGQLSFVSDGTAAQYILVLAARPDGLYAWFAVAADAQGVAIAAMPVVDATRPQATVQLDQAPARLAGGFSACEEAIGPILDAAVTGLACEQSAASQFLLELTVAHCKTRYQFGQPIGSFQALQHRLADLAILVDTSVSAVEYAVWAAADEPDRWHEAASIAGFVCAETMYTAAVETIQLHGGIGFTWEHPAHRYFRRALASRSQFGKPSWHRERLLRSLSI